MVYGELMLLCIDFMKTEFNLFGYTVSFWMLFVFMFIVGAVFMLIDGVLG